MAPITGGMTVDRALEIFIIAPIKNPELALSLFPIVAGALVMEVYFGRYSSEELGWNTAVGNSIIWLTTGIVLYTAYASGSGEKTAALGLILLGLTFGALDFLHVWPDYIAFFVSSSGIVYSLTYAVTILVRSSLEVDAITIKAAALFVIVTNVIFKLLEFIMPGEKDSPGIT